MTKRTCNVLKALRQNQDGRCRDSFEICIGHQLDLEITGRCTAHKFSEPCPCFHIGLHLSILAVLSSPAHSLQQPVPFYPCQPSLRPESQTSAHLRSSFWLSHQFSPPWGPSSLCWIRRGRRPAAASSFQVPFCSDSRMSSTHPIPTLEAPADNVFKKVTDLDWSFSFQPCHFPAPISHAVDKHGSGGV